MLRATLAVCLLSVSTVFTAAAHESGAVDLEALRSGGTGRVIVSLRTPTNGSAITPESLRRTVLDRHFQGTTAEIGQPGEIAITHLYDDPSRFAADVDFRALNALRNDPNVQAVEPDRWMRPAMLEIGETVRAPVLHADGIDGSGVLIVQFDTGVDIDHPFIAANLEDGLCFSTPREGGTSLCPGGAATAEGPDAAEACTDLPECAHGTQTAGIMVGSDSDMRGVAPGARLLPVQVFTRMEGSTYCGEREACLVAWSSDLEMAITAVRNRYLHQSDQIGAVYFGFTNLPFTDGEIVPDVNERCSNSLLNRIFEFPVVIPTGNEGRFQRWGEQSCSYRAAFYVQAENDNGEVADFSNTWIIMFPSIRWSDNTRRSLGVIPSLAARGIGVPTSTIGGGFTEVTGTSASAAQVAGTVALLRSQAPFTEPDLWRALFLSGEWMLDRRMNQDVASVRADAALEFLSQFNFGPIKIDAPISPRPEIGGALGEEVMFVGPVGGPFRLLPAMSSFEPTLGSLRISLAGVPNRERFEGLPIQATSDAAWLDAASESPILLRNDTNIELSTTASADSLAPGSYSATVSIEIEDLRTVRLPVGLRVGVVNDTIETAINLAGRRVNSVVYAASATPDPDPAPLGLSPDRPTLWWRWTASESRQFLVSARDDRESYEPRYRVAVFTGDARANLVPVVTQTRCIDRLADFSLTQGHYFRFEAQAGETYTFAAQAIGEGIGDAVAFNVFPANVTGHEDRTTPLEITGSEVYMPVPLHGIDAPCGPRGPLDAPGTGIGQAWFLWSPSISGRHSVEIHHGNTIEHTSVYDRYGRVRVFDPTGEHVLAEFGGAADIYQNRNFEGYFSAEVGEHYLISVEAEGNGGVILEIDGPETTEPPSNDEFAHATIVGPVLSSYTSNNRHATREAGSADATDAGRSQWWRFTAQSDGRAYVTMEGTISIFDFDTQISGIFFRVFSGDSYETLLPATIGERISYLNGWTIDHPQAYFDVEAGSTYYVRVDGALSSLRPFGDYRLTVGYGPHPTNDDFDDAVAIEFGDVITGQNRYASGEPGEPTEDFFHDFMEEREELGVWYRWTAPETGRYRMNATSSFINPQIAVYTGDQVDALSLVRGVAHNGGPPPVMTPFVFDFDAVAGTTYSIRVSSYMRQQGDFTFWLSPGAPYNDSFNSATRIEPNYPVGSEQTRFISIVDNTYATADPGEGSHAGFSPEASIWYGSSLSEYELAPYSINTSGSTVDTQITLYSPYYSQGSEPLVSNDNVADGLTSAEIFAPNRETTPRRNSPGIMFVITSPPGQRGIIRVNAGWDNTLYPRLRGATLPYARSGVVGQPITGFATLLNNGYRAGLDCGLALADPSQPFDLEFRPTDPATNAIDGAVGETRPADVLRPVTYLFALTPREPVAAREVALTYSCANADDAPSVAGVNTVLISADTTQQPDILSIGTTASNDGVIRIPSTSGVGFLSTAALNLGSTGEITFSADVTGTDIPVTIEVCETDLSNGGACRTPRAAQTTVSFGAGEVKTFAVFVRANGAVAFDPAGVRVFARWRDDGGVVRGATSAAVRTP